MELIALYSLANIDSRYMLWLRPVLWQYVCSVTFLSFNTENLTQACM